MRVLDAFDCNIIYSASRANTNLAWPMSLTTPQGDWGPYIYRRLLSFSGHAGGFSSITYSPFTDLSACFCLSASPYSMHYRYSSLISAQS